MADRILGGRYTVQDKVGIGGMATVYRGVDNVLGRTVAIKTMLPQYAADPSFAARFKQEAQAAAALQSPYIVGIYDWGKDADTYYIVMEYLRGTDLKSGIRKHGALDCRKVAQIGSQICQALSVAHKHDIIHRDIKPQNIMVQPDGNIKVMDFGIARAKNSHLTADNSVLGTAHYVSPEQTQGKELGPTSDLYSLGIVMYEAATGKVPFDGDDAISVALKQVNEQPIPPSQINPNVDATLEGIILKCMQKNPAARFQTADELRRVLNDYLAGRIVNLGEATSLISSAPTTQMNRNQATSATQNLTRTQAVTPVKTTAPGRISTSTGSQRMQPVPEKRGGKGKIVAAAIAALAVVALAVWGFITLTADPDQQAVPNLANYTETQARAEIAKYEDYFTVGEVTTEYSDTVDEGKLISQDPTSGTMASKGTVINLVFSLGKKPAADVEVPDLYNKTPDEANTLLTQAGFVPQYMGTKESDDVDSGHVVEQSVAAGETAKEGATIQYWTSAGVGQADASDHTGYYYITAQDELAELGFTNVETKWSYSDYYESGEVISQSPTGNQSKDTTITLTVSRGAEPTATTTNTNTGTGTYGGNTTGGGTTGTGTGDGTSTGDGTDTDSSGDTGTGTGTGTDNWNMGDTTGTYGGY